MKKIRNFLAGYIKSINWLPAIVITLTLNILLLFDNSLSWKSFLTLNGLILMIIVASFILFKIRKKNEN